MLKERHLAALTKKLRDSKPQIPDGIASFVTFEHARDKRAGWEAAVIAVADVGHEMNVRFDRQRFLNECGVNQSIV